jgi:3-oxoacyl-[acyl-carrier protein] reductase
MVFDVTDQKAVKDAVIRIKREQGKIDILVNNAGIMKDALIGMIDSETVRQTFDVNVFAVIGLIKIFSRLMIKQKFGVIINIASIAGSNGSAGQLTYSASKGAVIALTKSAAKELAPSGIRVNAISPGMIDTDLLRDANGAQRIAEKVSSIKMARLGTPQEVASVCTFLASDMAKYVTGQIIGVDGGMVI